MAVVCIMEWLGVTQEQYDQFCSRLDFDLRLKRGFPYAGRILQINAPREGGWYIMEVWVSQQAFDSFFHTYMQPVLQAEGLPPAHPRLLPLANFLGALDGGDRWHLDETVLTYDWQPLLWGRVSVQDEIAISLWRYNSKDVYGVYARFSHPNFQGIKMQFDRFGLLWLLRHPLGWMALLKDRDWLPEPGEGPDPHTIVKIPATKSLGRSNAPAQIVRVLTAEEFQEVLPWFLQDIIRSRVRPYSEWQQRFLADIQTVFGSIPVREKD